MLHGRGVVVTRPAEQADALCDAISACGGEPLRFPVIAVAPVTDLAPLEAASVGLDDFDIAFFVSPNAVRHALDYIFARRQWPAGLRVATVGPGSERALHEAGFEDVLAPSSGFDSESVLALDAFSPDAIRDRRVVIFRGDGGRELLGEALRARGARVDHVTAYRRFRPPQGGGWLIERARERRIDAIVLTSSEGVRNLVDMLGPEGMAVVDTVTAFVPHPRVGQFAREAGFRHVVVTEAGDEGIVRGLEAELGH